MWLCPLANRNRMGLILDSKLTFEPPTREILRVLLRQRTGAKVDVTLTFDDCNQDP